MKNKPEKIFLQIGCDPEDVEDFKDLSEVTWCKDKIHDSDLPYFSEEAILKAGEEGEINKVEVEWLVEILKR